MNPFFCRFSQNPISGMDMGFFFNVDDKKSIDAEWRELEKSFEPIGLKVKLPLKIPL